MTAFQVIILIAIPLLTFLSRAWPRWIMREPPLGDTVAHLAMIKAIRENGHRAPDPLPRWLPEQRLFYPTFFHWLLSYLSPASLVSFERVSGALLDTAHNALTMAAAYFILLGQGIETPLVVRGTALAGLLFTFSPRLIRPRERAFFLNPRPFGSLLVSVGFLGTFWFIWTGAWFGLILGMAALALASISHKFTLQVIVFLSPVISIIVGSTWFLVALVLGLLGAVLVTRGRALRLWSSQIDYSRLYRSHIAPRFPIVKDTAWVILHNIINAMRSGGNWQREAIKLVFNNEADWIVQLTWLAPVGIFMVLAVLQPLGVPPEFLHVGAWMLGAMLIGLITTLRPLRFLGQPTRYLEYAVLPASVALAYAAVAVPELASGGILVFGVLILFLIIVALYYTVALMVQKRIKLDEFFEAVAWLDDQPAQVVLCVPVHGLTSAVWNHTDHTIVGWLGQMNDQTSEHWLDDYLLLCPEQHFVLPYDLGPIIRRYGVDLLFCGPGVNHDLSGMIQSYTAGGYAAYRVK